MRVKFIRDYNGARGEQSYAKGAVIDMDEGVAAQLIDAGVARECPRTQAEIEEAVTKYYPGDENRTPRQIAERGVQVVSLSGDTRTDTEEQLGEDDPHVVRKDIAETLNDAKEEVKAKASTPEEKAHPSKDTPKK